MILRIPDFRALTILIFNEKKYFKRVSSKIVHCFNWQSEVKVMANFILNIKFYLTTSAKPRIMHAYKTRLKKNQLRKVHFIKVNELKLTQVELF